MRLYEYNSFVLLLYLSTFNLVNDVMKSLALLLRKRLSQLILKKVNKLLDSVGQQYIFCIYIYIHIVYFYE